jgi:hypothetical protein
VRELEATRQPVGKEQENGLRAPAGKRQSTGLRDGGVDVPPRRRCIDGLRQMLGIDELTSLRQKLVTHAKNDAG